MLRWGFKMLERTSPWGLVAGGIFLAMSIPAVRKGLRRVVVATAAEVMAVSESLRGAHREAGMGCPDAGGPPIAPELRQGV
jgi:hypothetical protein